MIKLAVSGCLGRMGQRISALASADPECALTTLLENPDHPNIRQGLNGKKISTDLADLKGCDVLIEFTTPEATIEHLATCLKHHIKMVIGTTGLASQHIEQLKHAAETLPIVFSSNMSIGVNILFKLTQLTASTTPSSYSVRIIEAHHIHKKDAPSGTAKTLAKIIEDTSPKKVEDIQAIREGEIIGDHKIIFESPDDTLILDHHAKNRDIFAKGALVAVHFVHRQQKGLFDMQDVLHLK